MNITTNYPGGNITVVEQKDNVVLLKPDLRDTTETWFYWNFSVEGAAGREITFQFVDDELIGRWGPAKSLDGMQWAFSQDEFIYTPSSFTYRFGINEQKVYFAFSLPYQLAHFEQFYQKIKHNKQVSRHTLVKTVKGNREVPILVIGREDAKIDIALSCRNHCCESVASYVLEGIMEYVASNEASFKGIRFHIAPFMDLDGVENGDQGKSRAPHDHNRDFTAQPIYETVQAWMDYVKKLNLKAGIDLHCPWKWGDGNDHIALIKGLMHLNENIERFSQVLKMTINEEQMKNSIPYHGAYDLLPGQSWVPLIPNATAANFYGSCGAKIAFTVEIPYFGEAYQCTGQNNRAFGMHFAKSLAQFVQS